MGIPVEQETEDERAAAARINWLRTYQSAFVDDAGKLQTRRDVYNIDGRLIAAVKSERAIIEPAPNGKPAEVASTGGRRRAATAAAPPAMSFFQSLFFGGRSSRPSHGIYR